MKFSNTILTLGATAIPAVNAQGDDPTTNTTIPLGTPVLGAYIIEIASGYSADSLTGALSATGANITTRLDLNFPLFTGVSVQIQDTENAKDIASQLANSSVIQNIWPVRSTYFPRLIPISVGSANASAGNIARSVHATKRDDAETPLTPHQRVQVDKMHAENITGNGILVAVVDTGIDYLHPALGGCFGPGCLVVKGWDFTGDDYWSGNQPVPDGDPRETCFGHGSHIAGIIAAQENPLGFIGAAPGAKLAAYKVSGCSGYTTNELLIAAFNRAFEDGADIISCSAGFDSNWAEDPFAIAASRIVDAGVPIVVALGNGGGDGLWTAATPATGENVVGIASVENTVQPVLVTKGEYSKGDHSTVEAFGWQNGSPEFTGNISLPATWVGGDVKSNAMACSALPEDLDLSGKIVIVRLATAANCYTDLQVNNLVARGAEYLMFYNGNGLYTNVYSHNQSIKAVASTDVTQGEAWLNALAANQSITISITDPASAGLYVTSLPNPVGAGYISTFTSWGPTWEVTVKPQFAAIGGNILSTYPLDMGAYSVLSGTSMSTPMVAGLYALMAEKLQSRDPKELRKRLSATAKPLQWYNGPELVEDMWAPVAQQGAGLTQVYDATKVVSSVDTVSLTFGDDDSIRNTQTFTVSNDGSTAIAYNLTHSASVTVTSLYEKNPGYLGQNGFPTTHSTSVARLSFEPESFSLSPGEKTQVTVSLTIPDAGLNSTLLPVYGGYIVVNGDDQSTLRIPYLGVRGSIHKTPSVVGTFYGGTYMSTSADHFGVPAEPGQVFTLPYPGQSVLSSDVVPKLIARPKMGLRKLRMDVTVVGEKGTSSFFEYTTVGNLPGMPTEYTSRYPVTQFLYGKLADGSVLAEGTYKILISGLRIGGNEMVRNDWDIVETTTFSIKYRQ